MRTKEATRNTRRALLAVLLALTFLPVMWAPSAGASRATGFLLVAPLQVSEDYDPHSGQYSGLFPFLINNSGSFPLDGTLSVSGLPAGWTWHFVEGQDILTLVDPGIVLRVTVHVETQKADPGVYQFRVSVDPGPATVLFQATIPLFGELELTSTPSVDCGIDDPATVHVTVTNLANGPDSFDLGISLPSSDWFYLTNDSLTSPVLKIGQSYTWTLSVHVPYSVEASVQGDSGYHLWFKASSRGDLSAIAMNMTLVRVQEHRALHLDFKQASYTQQDKGMVMSAMLENGGNAPETVALSVQAPPGWKIELPKQVRNLEPFERIETDVYVWPSDSTTTGTYSVGLKATTTGSSLTATTSALVMIPFRSYLSWGPSSQIGPDPLPGGAVRSNISLHNGGNHVELVELDTTEVPDGWAVTVFPSVVSIPAWGHVSIEATVITSKDPMRSLSGSHVVGLTARSLYSRTSADTSISVKVRPLAGLELTAVLPFRSMNPSLDPDPVYIFRLRNSGNVQVTARLSYSSGEGHASWLALSRMALTVVPGEVGTFHAVLTAPIDALAGDYAFSVNATTFEAQGATSASDIGLRVLETDVRVLEVQGRGPQSSTWVSSPRIGSGQKLDAIAWLIDKGSQPVRSVQLSLYVDGRYIATTNSSGAPGPSGTLWGVAFKLSLGIGSHNVSIRITTPGEKDTSDNEAWMKVIVAAPPPPVREGAAAAGIVLTSSTIVMLAITLNEGWKFKALLLFVVPLYTRLRPEVTLDNFTRGRIYGYIEANPGEHYNAIKKALFLPNGSLAHHLDMLMREGYVRFEIDGNYKRFYPSHMRLPADGKMSHEAGRMTRIQEIVLDTVRDRPGISQREISRALNLSPSTINYHIRLMATKGVLKLQRSLGRTMCYVGDQAPPEGTDLEVTVEEDPGL
jgi:uncharacterized membrane protein/DNA-binding CsgD family transcriptional regulator